MFHLPYAFKKTKASNANSDRLKAFLLLFINQKPAQHTKQYNNKVDVTVAAILSHKAYGRLLKNKIILFISNISHQVNLPIQKPTFGIHAKATKNNSTNKIIVDRGTVRRLVNKKIVGNW